jgi:hypothetical protein
VAELHNNLEKKALNIIVVRDHDKLMS